MAESLTPCANCPHPFAEHAEIEGMANRGHCKVPSCPCGAFAGEIASESQADEARYVIIARATDVSGNQGCQLTANGFGRPPEVPESVLDQLAETVKGEYRRIMGENPKHVGVTALPFLAHFDEPRGDLPAAAGIAVDDDVSFEEAVEAIGQAVQMFANLPPEVSVPSKDTLAVALFEIDKQEAVRAVKGAFDTRDKLGELANALVNRGGPATELANRILAGHFDPDELEG